MSIRTAKEQRLFPRSYFLLLPSCPRRNRFSVTDYDSETLAYVSGC